MQAARSISLFPQVQSEQRAARKTEPTDAVWTPSSELDGEPTSSSVIPVIAGLVLARHVEEAFIRALTDPVDGDSAAQRADVRERTLADLVAQLSASESLALENRLRADSPAEPVARAFRRFTAERRGRVLTSLAARRKVLAGFAAIARTSSNHR